MELVVGVLALFAPRENFLSVFRIRDLGFWRLGLDAPFSSHCLFLGKERKE